MVADSDDLEKYFTPEQIEQWHREHKVDDDPRITRLGAFLRSTSRDEFPQFINVLLYGRRGLEIKKSFEKASPLGSKIEYKNPRKCIMKRRRRNPWPTATRKSRTGP